MNIALLTCHFNFASYKRPRQNMMRFLRYCDSLGLPVYGVEILAPWQDVPLTRDCRNWRVLKAVDNQLLFQKEAALNIAQTLAPPEVDRLILCDGDLFFLNPCWALETSIKLEQFYAVQPYGLAKWTDQSGQAFFERVSCARNKIANPNIAHPGFAWALRRSFWHEVGGLYPFGIGGGGDFALACGLMGKELPAWNMQEIGQPNLYMAWHRRCSAWSQGRITSLDGVVYHDWHGDVKNRRYCDRHTLFTGLDAEKHLRLADNGLVEFTEASPAHWRDNLMMFFRYRNEDG